MRMGVIVDARGNVQGTYHCPDAKSAMNAGILPEPGQSLFEIDVPDEVARQPVDDLHRHVLDKVRDQIPGLSLTRKC